MKPSNNEDAPMKDIPNIPLESPATKLEYRTLLAIVLVAGTAYAAVWFAFGYLLGTSSLCGG